MLGMSLTTDVETYYIPVGHKKGWLGTPTNVQIPPDLFKDVRCPLIAHNWKFDYQVLRNHGIYIPTGNLWDTMLMATFVDENKIGKDKGHSLETVAPKYLGKESQKEVAKAKAMRDIWEISPPHLMAQYAEQDARLLPDLFDKLYSLQEPRWIEQWENVDREFMLLLADIETLGLPIDRELAQKQLDETFARVCQIERELGFDPAKSSQLHPKLFGEGPGQLGLPVPSRTPKSGEPQVKLDWLLSIGHPVTALVYEHSKLSKQLSSYFRPYVDRTTWDHPRLHCTFNQMGTVTQRMTCEKPNLQQIPRVEYESPTGFAANVKKLFRPEFGQQLWEIDFRTLEYRTMACYCKNPKLLKIFREEGDLHQMVADDVGVDRHTAKNKIVYAIAYGAGDRTIAEGIGRGLKEGYKIVQQVKDSYPELFAIKDECTKYAQANMEISMWFGRKRHFQWPSECHKAFNAIVQGGSFEIVKRSMLNLRRAGFTMSNQVHDSVWLSVNGEDEVMEAQRLMEDWTEDAFDLRFSTDRKRLN